MAAPVPVERAHMKPLVPLALCIALGSLPVAAQTAAPYAGQQARSIKALSADDVRGYLAGEGIGMAKAGELNHYPGPKHVLAMSAHLLLSEAQTQRLQNIEARMTADAVPLGRDIVREESALDARFAQHTIDEATLRQMTAHIALLQGQLRAVHLLAHLATRTLLTDQQVRTYDRMRGYDGSSTMMDISAHQHG
jgi:hypothetical protein